MLQAGEADPADQRAEVWLRAVGGVDDIAALAEAWRVPFEINAFAAAVRST